MPSILPLATIVIALFCFTTDAMGLCVKARRANLRSGPSTNHPISWEVYRNMPFTLVKKQGAWYQVRDVDGDTHWIFSKLVTKSHRCAVVKKKKVNLRTGPGTRHPQSAIYPSARKYESFKLLRVKKGWAQLQDMDGDRVWAFRKLLWVQ